MIILDASALVAWLYYEAGWKLVDSRLAGSQISAVNLSEVLGRIHRDTGESGEVLKALKQCPIEVVPFTATDAECAAILEPLTRRNGLSLGDRACLALGIRQSGTILTTDRAWGRIGLPLAIEILR